MACGTNPDAQILAGRACQVGGPASAGDVGLFVTGMNIGFHDVEKEPRKITLQTEAATKKSGKGPEARTISALALFSIAELATPNATLNSTYEDNSDLLVNVRFSTLDRLLHSSRKAGLDREF